MTRKQFTRKAKTILKRRRDALRQAISDRLNQLNSSAVHTVGDHADAAIEDDQEQIASNLAELEARELAQIEHALERLRAGKYGICERCQQPIPTARLQAVPYATLCVKCRQLTDTGAPSHGLTEQGPRVAASPKDQPKRPPGNVEAAA